MQSSYDPRIAMKFSAYHKGFLEGVQLGYEVLFLFDVFIYIANSGTFEGTVNRCLNIL